MKNYLYSIVNVFSKVANTSLLFLVIINVVSKELFGLFSYYQALTLMLLVFIDYGFNLYMAKELTLNPRHNQKLVSQVITIKLIASVGIVAFIGLGTILKVIYSPSLLFLVLIIGIINSLIATYGVLYRNYGQFGSEALISFSMTIVSIGVLFISGNVISNLSILLLPFILFKFLHLFVMTWSLKKIMRTSHFNPKLFEFRQAKNLIRRNFSYALHLTIGTLYFQIDTLVLKQLDSLDAVAEYTAAFKLIGIILVGTEVINNVLIPKFVRLKETKPTSYLNGIGKAKKMIIYSSVAIISLFLVISAFLTNFIFPKGFESTNDLLIILSFMVYFRFISTIPGIVITIENMQKYRTNIAILGLTANTILSIILVPFLSYYGAAISSLVSAVLIWLAYERLLKRKGF
ncbi:oligosaccharide flippase family protein [Exiguobacterium sp. ZOR0005]|uniref:oligosaccharide flippase family protein n=1 Tax=Exiguobacterium sp. ZOR0005 TaxID=1339226 RepID=UPI0006478CDC|nr:oligosaccharide flippase family protein [Exiguobacterium sp. ZOR0005]